VVRVRPFNHTGAGRPDRFVESSFARQIAEIEAGLRPPEMAVGNLDAVRDFLDVEDVIGAYVRLLEPGVPAGVYNVASGTGTRIRDLLDLLLAQSEVRPEVETDEARWRPADTSVGSAERLAKATGWAPEIPLQETLKNLLDGWRQAVRAG
jgi:GDP-4-dehydro-6-deoxy-D-mannose reductase